MRILKAEHLGMCFGVRDAIALAEQHAESERLTLLGDLVHNGTVNASLRARGVEIERDPDCVRTPTVMITAHGASQRRLDRVRRRGFHVVEATCPLVHAAHRALAGLVAAGFHPVVVGKADHVEVLGMTEDLAVFDVVLDEGDIERLVERERFGVVAQTTQPIDKVRHLVARLRTRFPRAEVRFVDTVCQPTKLRQHSAEELAQRSAVVVAIGGPHSNNTKELVATCRRHCERVFQVETAAELRPDWFRPDDTVGITAGTSTPAHAIDEVEAWLRSAFALFLGPRIAQSDRPVEHQLP